VSVRLRRPGQAPTAAPTRATAAGSATQPRFDDSTPDDDDDDDDDAEDEEEDDEEPRDGIFTALGAAFLDFLVK
jgi:ribosomal protein L12E/L44/L45/RPP1/RPP2